MSKQVRWRVPFVSISGTHYRVDIYDEQDGTWSGITQLLAGETPFVTEEDSSEDFFAPIRTQSGTLQVCTALPDGGRISLDELLPANNISRPVRLINIDESKPYASAIEWMGFLSCEAYSQAYTETPENLSLPVIGVLEAMDSVPINQSVAGQLLPLNNFIYNVLTEIDNQTGMSNFSSIAYSLESMRIFFEEIDTTSMFNSKEHSHEEGTEYVIEGVSCKNVLERLCKFMGWTVREHKRTVYFQRLGDKLGMFSKSLTAFNNNPSQGQAVLKKDIINATDLEWRGVDHRRSILQGAKSVEVVAKLEKYDANISLPICPDNNLENKTRQLLDENYVSAYICKNDLFYNGVCIFNYYRATLTYQERFTKGANCTLDDVISRCALAYGLWTSSVGAEVPEQYKYMGAFLARLGFGSSVAAIDQFQTGLYISGVMNTSTSYVSDASSHKFDIGNEVFILKSSRQFTLRNGKLKVKITSKMLSDCNGSGQNGKCNYIDFKPYNKLYLYVKYGNKYGIPGISSWTENFQYFSLYHNNNTFEANIPITNEMSGNISLGVFGATNHLDGSQAFDMYDLFITELSVEYEPNTTGYMSDRSENHYFRLLSTNFRDEISVETELASDLNNQPSPSIIMDTEYTTLKTLEYRYDSDPSHTDPRRPEVDLLNRLALYYSAKRQRLELITKHPLVGLTPSQMSPEPLPYLTINGISPDTRKYIPLSESRDWRTDVCTLTCFETPQ